MIAYLDEGDEQSARKVADLIDEKQLNPDEKKMYGSRKWLFKK